MEALDGRLRGKDVVGFDGRGALDGSAVVVPERRYTFPHDIHTAAGPGRGVELRCPSVPNGWWIVLEAVRRAIVAWPQMWWCGVALC